MNARISIGRRSYDSYQSAVQDISSDDTLSEGGDAVGSAQSTFRQAWANTLSERKCPAPTPTS